MSLPVDFDPHGRRQVPASRDRPQEGGQPDRRSTLQQRPGLPALGKGPVGHQGPGAASYVRPYQSPPEQIPLKVPNVVFDFDVPADSIQLLTDTSKSNSTLASKLWVLIIAYKWVCYVFDVSVRVDSMQYLTHTSKTSHGGRIWRLVLSVVSVHDPIH